MCKVYKKRNTKIKPYSHSLIMSTLVHRPVHLSSLIVQNSPCVSTPLPDACSGEVLPLQPRRRLRPAEHPHQDTEAIWRRPRYGPVEQGPITELQLAEGGGHLLLLGTEQGQCWRVGRRGQMARWRGAGVDVTGSPLVDEGLGAPALFHF